MIAPYATALAALFAPHAATANLRELERLGARGEMGFIEALDFTPERQTGDSTRTIVNTFMAHHQGMTIVALANVLLDGAARRWGMSEPRISAVASLLHERAPREVSQCCSRRRRARARRRTPAHAVAGRNRAGRGAAPTHLLSNGRYSVALRANGAGWSRWGRADVSRWRDDALRDAYGSFFYLRCNGRPAGVDDAASGADDAAAYRAPSTPTACFRRGVARSARACTVWVSPEDDIELRRIELWSQ